jgi:hypothetical protein
MAFLDPERIVRLNIAFWISRYVVPGQRRAYNQNYRPVATSSNKEFYNLVIDRDLQRLFAFVGPSKISLSSNSLAW